jgi:hypothetical protein
MSVPTQKQSWVARLDAVLGKMTFGVLNAFSFDIVRSLSVLFRVVTWSIYTPK